MSRLPYLFLILGAIGDTSNGRLFESVGGNRQIDLFSSTDGLKKLYHMEKEVRRKLKDYLDHTDRQLEALDGLLEKHYKVRKYITQVHVTTF